MTRINLGIALILVGVFGMILLLTYGGPVMPHIVGPATLAVIGAIVLFFKKKTA